MSRESINRRDFNKLGMAALGGLATGTVIGCGGGDSKDGDEKDKKDDKTAKKDDGGEKVSGADCWLSGEKNVCRGLNMCEGHGQGKHECAGQGSCFSGMAKHGCKGDNDCACQGGCGDHPGENACKGKGGCAVPLHGHEDLDVDSMWGKARSQFEKALSDAGETFGDPGPAAG